MIWIFFICVGVLVAAGFAALALGRASYDPMPEPTHTAHDVQAGRLRTASDVDEVRFDTALRGYRMDQVDEVLAALRDRLAGYESGDTPTTKLPRTVVRRPPAATQPAAPQSVGQQSVGQQPTGASAASGHTATDIAARPEPAQRGMARPQPVEPGVSRPHTGPTDGAARPAKRRTGLSRLGRARRPEPVDDDDVDGYPS